MNDVPKTHPLSSDSSARYTAYGLNISSCIPCPELSPGSGTPDVTISYGAVPDSLDTTRDKGPAYEANPDELLFSIDGVAKYMVSQGREILIERAATAEDSEVRLFLLGSAFGALLFQRGLLPLHGSAIKAHGGCVVILADPGLGKSTLAGVFRNRGYRIVADDVCVVSIAEDGAPLVLPGYPQLKLGMDVANELSEDPDLLVRIHPRVEKVGLRLQEDFYHDPLPLRHLYVLETSAHGEFNLEPLKGVEKLTAIINNTYRLFFIEGLGVKASHFKQCVAVAKQTPLTRVTRPAQAFLLDELAQLLEEDFLRERPGQD
jgi:hypothetical protein